MNAILIQYGAFLVSKFKTSFQTCYFSIQIFNPVIKTWNSSKQHFFNSIMLFFYSNAQSFVSKMLNCEPNM